MIKTERRDVPREFLSPLGVNSRDVRTTFFPLGLPNLAAVERGTVEVRTSERIELRIGEVQRRPKLIGQRERVEIRCVDKRVVATDKDKNTREGWFKGFIWAWIQEEREGEKKKGVTSHLWACNPMKADINDDRLSFGPTPHHSCRRRRRAIAIESKYRQ